MNILKQVKSFKGFTLTPISATLSVLAAGGWNLSILRIGYYYRPGKFYVNDIAALFSIGYHKIADGMGSFERYVFINLLFFIRWHITVKKLIILDLNDIDNGSEYDI